jgi:hypothetical protein
MKPKTRQQNNGRAASSATSSQERPKVQLVSCPSAFPISVRKSQADHRKRPHGDRGVNNSNSNSNNHNNNHNSNKTSTSASSSNPSTTKLLDWHETAKEVRAYGATAFARKKKRKFEDEQYFQLTGRHRKKPKVPLPIVRGIRKAAEKREAKLRLEAQQAGIVLPKKSLPISANSKKQNGKSFQKYQQDGPVPSIGFTKNGIYRVSKDKFPNERKRR